MRRFIVLTIIALGLLCLLASPALANAQTFCVQPGKSGDDTGSIQKAFDRAVKAGPGSTVRLSAGTFYTNNIFVKDFKGCFVGAGEDQTVIENVGVVPVTWAVEPFPFLIGFSGGNVSVSHMGFDITGDTPAEGWYTMWGGGPYTALNATVLVTGSASASFDQVGFAAASGDLDGHNVGHDIFITGAQQWLTPPAVSPDDSQPVALAPTGGVDCVGRCSFAGTTGVLADGLTGGRLTVGGSAARQNVFDTVYGCEMRDSSNSTIVISHNLMQITDGEGIELYQSFYNPATPPPPLPAPHYFICDNNITATGYGGGMLLRDDSMGWGDAARLDATITGNTIHLENNGNDAGISGLWVNGTRVLGNRIWGHCYAGIDVGAWPWPGVQSTGWKIIGNDVSGVQVDDSQIGVPTAQIWLGPDATRCLVVGGRAPTTVLDQGTHNTLINVTRLPVPASASALSMRANAGSKAGLMGRPR